MLCPDQKVVPGHDTNKIRDMTANLLTDVYSDVCIEPELQVISREALKGVTSNAHGGAHLGIGANAFWGGRFERTHFDV